MRTNADATLYNKYVDPTTRSEKWQRAVILAVTWENRKAANTIATGGQIAADSAYIYIPMTRGANYLPPKAWQSSKAGKWTLQEGDVILRGAVSDELSDTLTLTGLKAKYDDVLVISSVDTMDNSSMALRHWKVGAK